MAGVSIPVTVGGLPGTGTSTLCRLLAPELGLEYVYAGQIFRDEATARGMDLADFGRLCQDDPAVDQALDARQLDHLRHGPLLLEGRLAGWLAHDHGVPAFKVWVTCDDHERYRRIAERDGGSLEDQAERAREREASEADRYHRYYGVRLSDVSFYDLVLDSGTALPHDLAEQVLLALRTRS